MVSDLEQAKERSADHPDAPPINPVVAIHTGRRGRPRLEINSDVLETAMQFGGPTALSNVFGVSSRTVRRRALESGLSEPGEPVYVEFTGNDGVVSRFYTSSTASQSTLSDDQLDTTMLQILTHYPTLGRRMIDGQLRYLGIIVPRARIQESYARVHGPPVAAFGIRRIMRRVYKVQGYNSLAHHDGQHGK